jgi:hypothetical protein
MSRGERVNSAEIDEICFRHIQSNTDGKIHPVKLNPFHVRLLIMELHQLRQVLYRKNSGLKMVEHGSTTPCWCGHDEITP